MLLADSDPRVDTVRKNKGGKTLFAVLSFYKNHIYWKFVT